MIVGDRLYAILPAACLLLIRVLDATLIHLKLKPNPFLERSILKKRMTAVVQDGNGNLVAPGSERIAIILLGAKSNHHFGFLSPKFMKTFNWLAQMNASFDQVAGPRGCESTPLSCIYIFLPHLCMYLEGKIKRAPPPTVLGQTIWQRKDEHGSMEFVFLSYWRDIDSIHAFAHSELHCAA